MNPAPPPVSIFRKGDSWRWLPLLVGTIVFLGLAWRQHRFVDKYAVNMMFWDQWDFYSPLFHGDNAWKIFDYEHAPHRQGVGFLLTSVLAKCSGWNSRWDAFGASFVMIGAAIQGLYLAWRCGARASLSLLAIPLLFFNTRQYEMFVASCNISHGAMPIFLFMAWSLVWFTRSINWRLAGLSLLAFLLIFTGFGIFVGLITPLMLLIEGAQAIRTGQKKHALGAALALTAVGASWIIFAHGYHFDAAVAGFHFPYKRPLEYFYFIGLMLANFHGVPGHGAGAIAFGLVVAAILAGLCLWHGWRFVRHGVENERRSVVIFCLAAYALIYCANAAIGRVCLGFEQASAASRYVTLMIPAGLAIFLHLATLRAAPWLGLVYALLLVPGTIALRQDDWNLVHGYSDGRRAWKAAYLSTHDETKANERAHFRIYPAPVTDRLKFLEQHQLNLFNPSAKP